MTGETTPSTVERARRELARLMAFRDGELAWHRKHFLLRLSWWEIGALILGLEWFLMFPCISGHKPRLRTRFERLQRLDKLIAERDEVAAKASSLR